MVPTLFLCVPADGWMGSRQIKSRKGLASVKIHVVKNQGSTHRMK